MSSKDLYAIFLDMETELNLFEKKIDGIEFWALIRMDIFQEILEKRGLYGQGHLAFKKNPMTLYRIFRMTMCNFLIKNPFFSQQAEILFFGHPRRKLLNDEKWWDIYCDPIIEATKKKYIYLEIPYIDKHFFPPKTQVIKYFDFPITLLAIKKRMQLTRIYLSNYDQFLITQIAVTIKNKLGITIDIKKYIMQSLQQRKGELPLFLSLLRRVRPKIAIIVVSYGKESFIEACKQLHIPVVELQHGIITPYHMGYSFPDYRTKNTFPDYLFVWGDFWRDTTDFPIDKNCILSVGYPFLENQAKIFADIKKRKQIIFLSQGPTGKQISKFAVNLSRKQIGYNIVYKLHPGEALRWKGDYPWLNTEKIEIIDNEKKPLYQLLAESEIQIGVNSTAIFEGLNFGLKTYLLNLPGVEFMEPLINKGYAKLVISEDDFCKNIKGDSVPCDTSAFFRQNALYNTINAVQNIMEGKPNSCPKV